MTGLELFGWLILVIATGYTTFVSVVGTYVSLGFGGKIDGWMYFIYSITLGLWALSIMTCPFTIVFN